MINRITLGVGFLLALHTVTFHEQFFWLGLAYIPLYLIAVLGKRHE